MFEGSVSPIMRVSPSLGLRLSCCHNNLMRVSDKKVDFGNKYDNQIFWLALLFPNL